MHEITSQPAGPADFGSVVSVTGFDRIRAQYPAHLSDESKLSCGSFDYLFFPCDEAQVAAVVTEMSRRCIPVTVAGARTGLVGGCVPTRGALISLEKLNRVHSLYYASAEREWRLRAQAAVPLADLNRMAMSKNVPDIEHSDDPEIKEHLRCYREDPRIYFYPPDPTEMSASLGGTVATNASGARTYRYGPTRDWVRKLRVVLMNGEILDVPRGRFFASASGWFTLSDSRGRACAFRVPEYRMPRTKNTAGFYAAPHMDLIDLFIGSEGAFGIITAVDVGLLPWEPKCAIVQFTRSDEQALDLVEALRSEKRVCLDFLEFYSTHALELLHCLQQRDARQVGMPPIPPAAGAAVFFELSFDPLAEAPDYAPLLSAIGSAGANPSDSWAAYEPRELARCKKFRHLLPETVSKVIAERKKKHPGLHRLSSDLAVPDEFLRPMWKIYCEGLARIGIEWVAFGHIGNNHLHISTMPRDEHQLAEGLRLFAEFARAAVGFGGTVSAEHGIGKLKAKFLPEMFSKEEIEQMKAVKKALDPDLLLNRGNIFLE